MNPTLQILVVDDNPVNRILACRILEKEGFSVSLADNGKEAVDCVLRDMYDVVLMDLSMPVMDGIEATLKIRECEQELHRRTPIVALTAQTMSEDRKRCLEAGMDAYVTKPVYPAILIQAILDVCERIKQTG